jgi:RNA polymerase sigma factor (TIGR02999 family)
VTLLDRPQPDVYGRLRDLACRFLYHERPDHTLQPTALAHEVYLRLAEGGWGRDLDSPDVLSLASRVMRDVLVDHARRRRAAKRGGHLQRHPLDTTCLAFEERAVDLLALDEALSRLSRMDPEAGRIVEMRFFGGLSERDIANALEVSTRTVRRGWRAARVWLARELEPDA